MLWNVKFQNDPLIIDHGLDHHVQDKWAQASRSKHTPRIILTNGDQVQT